MRNRLLRINGPILLLTMLIAALSASAAPVVYNYSGSIATYNVTTTGAYQITANGAQGGDAFNAAGGLGAAVTGDIELTSGTTLYIAVGGKGAGEFRSAGGGGGGTFVYTVTNGNNVPLVVVGGGGGGGLDQTAGLPASAGSAGQTGRGPNGDGGTGGQNGSGGGVYNDIYFGGGGAGFFLDGESTTNGGGGSAAPTFAGGLRGKDIGVNGGFGGGGASGGESGGGGGGYSGGGGGGTGIFSGTGEGGGGGGSYLDPSFITIGPLLGDANRGDGEVIITQLSDVPEPSAAASLALLLGLAEVGSRAGRARRHPLRQANQCSTNP